MYYILEVYWALCFVIMAGFIVKQNKISPLNPLIIIVSFVFFGVFCKLIYLHLLIDDSGLGLGEGDVYSLTYGSFVISLFVFSVFFGFSCLNKKIKIAGYLKSDGMVLHGGGFLSSLFFAAVLFFSVSSFFFFLSSLDFKVAGISAKRFLSDGAEPSSRFFSFDYFLFKLSQLSEVVFYYSIIYFYVGKNLKSVWLFISSISMLMVLLTSIVFSNRVSVIIIFIDFLVISYFFSSGNIKKKYIFYFIFAVLSVLLMSVLRSSGQKSIFDHLFGGRYLADISRVSTIVSYFKDNELSHLDFSGFNQFVVSYINSGRYIGENVFGFNASGVPLGGIVEFYLFSGFLSIFVFSVIYGVVLRFIYNYFRGRSFSMLGFICAVVVYSRIMVFFLNNGVGVTLYQILIDLIPIVIFYCFLSFSKGKIYKLARP